MTSKLIEKTVTFLDFKLEVTNKEGNPDLGYNLELKDSKDQVIFTSYTLNSGHLTRITDVVSKMVLYTKGRQERFLKLTKYRTNPNKDLICDSLKHQNLLTFELQLESGYFCQIARFYKEDYSNPENGLYAIVTLKSPDNQSKTIEIRSFIETVTFLRNITLQGKATTKEKEDIYYCTMLMFGKIPLQAY